LFQDGSNLDRIRPLLQIRWRTAVVARRWELIHADLDRLRRVDPLGNLYWLRGHVDALRASLLVPPSFGKELKETCLDVLSGCEDWSPETERLLGEVEEIERMLAEVNLRYKHWHSVFLHEIGLPKSVWQELSAFRMSCQTDPAILRLLLEPLLTEWANDPVCGLGAVDRLFEYFPVHAVRLASLINGCISTGWNNLSVLDGDALKRALLIDLYHERRLRRPSVDRHVSEFRRGILRFCVDEQVDLEPVIEVLSQLTPNLPWDCEFHPLRLEADDALRTVIRGCLALWEEPAGVVS
ncbi:MAG TPA: hypothetical protein VL132_01060, partial [Planctomycetaceae bacterium]|nr:hypothetical protein [Planctomycetaceae bacterium]